MERYNITVKDNPFDGCPYADMVVSDDGAYVRYDDAQRALDAEREKAKMELLKVENTTLRQLVEAILLADERGQGLPFKEAMDAAAKAINWNSLPPPTEERHE